MLPKEMQDAIDKIPDDKVRVTMELCSVIERHLEAGVHPATVWAAVKGAKMWLEDDMPNLLGG